MWYTFRSILKSARCRTKYAFNTSSRHGGFMIARVDDIVSLPGMSYCEVSVD